MQKFLSTVKFIFGMVLILALSVVIAYSMWAVSSIAVYEDYKSDLEDGYAYLESGDFDKSIAAFESAYLRDNTEEAAVGLAKAWFAKGDAEQAITVLANRIGLYRSTEEMEALLKEYKESIGIYEKIMIGNKEVSVTDTMIYIKDYTLTPEDFEKLSKFTNVVTLTLENCGISDISFLKDCHMLMSLSLSGNPISDFTVLADKPDLRTLYINDTAITDFSQLHQLTQLTTLNANGNWINEEDLNALEAALPGVEIYAGHDYLIKTIQFAGETFLSNVETLDLSSRGISDTTALAECNRLLVLNLSDNRIGWISGLDQISPLTELNLNNNRLSNISALSPLDWMQRLYLANNPITDISVLAYMPLLQELDLTGARLYHGHDALSGLTDLRKLNLSNSLWKDALLQYIPMNSMEELDLRNNPGITEAEVKHFIAQYPNVTIYHDYM